MGVTPVCHLCLVLEYQHHCWHYTFLGTRLRKSIKSVYDQTDACLLVFWENRILTISPIAKITFSLQAAAYQLFYHVTARKTAGLLHSAGWCSACFPWEENTQPAMTGVHEGCLIQLPAANCDWLNLLLSWLFSAPFWGITSVLICVFVYKSKHPDMLLKVFSSLSCRELDLCQQIYHYPHPHRNNPYKSDYMGHNYTVL